MEKGVDLGKPHPQTSDLAWVRYKQQIINGTLIRPLMLRLLMVQFTTANVAFISMFYGSTALRLAKVMGGIPILAVYVAACPGEQTDMVLKGIEL